MVYTKPVRIECSTKRCPRAAKFEVLNSNNAPIGQYCPICCKNVVKRLEAQGA